MEALRRLEDVEIPEVGVSGREELSVNGDRREGEEGREEIGALLAEETELVFFNGVRNDWRKAGPTVETSVESPLPNLLFGTKRKKIKVDNDTHSYVISLATSLSICLS